jgi:hypothetical protein
MRAWLNAKESVDIVLAIIVSFLCIFVTPADEARARDIRRQAADIVARIQRADYEGDRAALRRLRDELTPLVSQDDRALAARVLYWRGFALWRRAFNGGNETPWPQDMESDFQAAIDDFREAQARDPGFVDAKVGEASCTVAIGVIHLRDKLGPEMVLKSYKLVDEAMAADPDNPRLLWVHGANTWYKPAARGGGQDPAFAIYSRGLELARKQRAQKLAAAGTATAAAVADSLNPTWGEPELLMTLAWSNLHRATPDPAAAERYAQEALALVPHWHYLRDILMKQIREAPR